ncbi:hemerythrin domain-containing protein [Amycolatopsis sp. DSM 110486]|uniref:hemerythrin domain-containing protein n=1 Tax=Amycolatopsis sp. DSM 110486 TaxID=2865832 RepID=UPI001C6A38A2|nr:hemerythrin domain-containing protein [Amycolatopsis sp. DSM 110486]QYN19895.1 hemerythrin domain-containing protein [Amycolatopsis sp. DSM 110486]
MSTDDLVSVLAEDHLGLSRICTELEIDHGSPENRREVADHLIAQLVRHEVAEEPYLPPGPALHGADDLMRPVEGLGPQDARFERLPATLLHAVRQHLREAGPAVTRPRNRYPADRLRELGQDVREGRRAADSLPHPAIAGRTPPNALLRTGPGFVDRVRATLTSVH